MVRMRLFLASCLLATCCHAARADYAVPHADLVCDGASDVALVRVVMSWNEDPPRYATLPDEVDGGLSQRAGTDRTDCRLPHGWHIRIRAGQEQAFAHGPEGADPPAFFSLWINERKILSRFVWKPGYGESSDDKPPLIGLAIRPGGLTFCRQKPGEPAATCNRQRLAIRAHPIDRREYPTASQPNPPVGTVLVAAGSAEPSFCRRHIGLLESDALDVSEPRRSPLAVPITWTRRQSPESYAVGSLAGTFSNVGARRVFLLNGSNHYFDGDIVVLAPRDTSEREIPTLFPDGDLDKATAPPPRGWTIISGGPPALYPNVSPRYVHFTPEEIDRELYFLAYPANRKVHPTAILLKPLLEGGFNSVCVFQRVEPHY
jgi:hypothetical protein